MNQEHQAHPEFVSNLEWQVRTALRREERFAQPIQSRSGGRMKIVTLVLVSALFGAGGVVVKDEVQEARRQEVLLAEVVGNQRLTEMELEFRRSQLQEVKEQFDAGLVHEDALLGGRLAVRETELRLQRLRLNEEEIRASGREPDDRLSAPLVGGRDFVSERLELEAAFATEEINVARTRTGRILELFESGMVVEAEAMQGRAALRQVESRLEEISRRMDLRQEVLEGTLSGAMAEITMELNQVRAELAVLVEARQTATLQLEQMENRFDLGLVEESQLQGARLHLMEIQTRVEFLQKKVEILEAEGREE